MAAWLATVANGIWLASGLVAMRRFRWALRHPAAAQRAGLQAIVKRNLESEFGRTHDFSRISSVADFQERVPLATYDAYVPAITRMAAGESGVLTTEPVKLFEPSSGSTATAKLIPYTTSLQKEFQAGLAAWIGNLYGRMPQLMAGPAYWSLTPLMKGRQLTVGRIPIGFEEDSAYLGTVGRLVEAALAVPNQVKQLASMDDFRYATLRHLLSTSNLRLISVWNPTYLSLLLNAFGPWWEQLMEDVAAGTLTLSSKTESNLHAALSQRLRPDPARAVQLRCLDPRDPATLAQIWPQLTLLSCWADGPSSRFAAELALRLPNVQMQPKGLLATEAMVSLPWVGVPGGVLALTSHFLEFEDEAGAIFLAHELRPGGIYKVVVTTGGGLYRYQLHDQVEVVGHVAATPTIRFVGKADRVADWFGEKLNEQFVARCLEELWAEVGFVPRFALVALAELREGYAYTLYLEGNLPPEAEAFAGRLDQLLRRSFHYDYCRRLGQLGPTRIRAVQAGSATYLAVCQARGMKLGNIKPTLLDRGTEWEVAFDVTTCYQPLPNPGAQAR